MKKIIQRLMSAASMVPMTAMGLAGGMSLFPPGCTAAAPGRQSLRSSPGETHAASNPVAARRTPVDGAFRMAASCKPCAPAPVAADCYVPRLWKASCNPCAAKKPACKPCNPCAAKKPGCSPCNPCAAKKPACAPCKPCAAKKPVCRPCSPCSPCAAAKPVCGPCAPAAPAVALNAGELGALYGCLKPKMQKAYRGGGHWAAGQWSGWRSFATSAYRSDTHSGRFVMNYANQIAAKAYGAYEKTRRMPVGSTLAKPSFTVSAEGRASIGPLFIMEKMTKGWNAPTADWRYAMIMPDGSTYGMTNGPNAKGVAFCHDCHAGGEDNDFLLFLPEEYRK